MTTNIFLFFVLICFITTGCAHSQSPVAGDPFTFKQISYEEAGIATPGRGAQQWHNGSERVDSAGPAKMPPPDIYYRFSWTQLEGAARGSYDFTYFDNIIVDAIDHRQKLSFGIMPVFDGGGTVSYDGAKSAYPEYLHKAMQADNENNKDWISNGVWIPNWNSPHYLERLRALHDALVDHIMTSSHKGVAFKNAIFCIDVRGYGNYGEWHNAGIANDIKDYPRGRRATIATLKTIIDHHTQVFKIWPLTIMIAAFDAEQFDAIMNPAEVGYYALTTRNEWGLLGWRRDQWGATDSYLEALLKHNKKKWGAGPAFNDIITSRFRTSPVTGEPPRYINPGGDCEYWDLERQLTDYGATSLSDGNWGGTLSECGKNNVLNAFKKTGYKLILEGGNLADSISTGQPFSLTLHWKNIGIAPTYEEWTVMLELKDSMHHKVWSDTSQFNPKLFIPQKEFTAITDQFVLPENLSPGKYNLDLIIRDPSRYRQPLPLAIEGRNDDGSYTLKIVTINSGHSATRIKKGFNAGTFTIYLSTHFLMSQNSCNISLQYGRRFVYHHRE